MSKTIFITGAAGYVGEMLCEQLRKCPEVGEIIALDKEPSPDCLKKVPNLTYLHCNTADTTWPKMVAKHKPDVVIHTAWQIRTLYGDAPRQWRWNVTGSENVFSFALTQPSVKKLIHFSSASVYAARSNNRLDHYFAETERARVDTYQYANEKKVTEQRLKEAYDAKKSDGQLVPQVTVLRPAAITGPRGRYMRVRFGLQSALQGNLKGGWYNRIVTLCTALVPATKGWARQFIHEDDVADAVRMCVLKEQPEAYSVVNLTPTSRPVFAPDMAAAVGKKIIPVSPWMVRLAFAFFWHATRGRVPTSPGAWRFYSYPLLMSGEKLARRYTCRHKSQDAFCYTDGRYEQWVPSAQRRPKPPTAGNLNQK